MFGVTYIDITVAGMRNGEKGLAFRYELIAHEEERLVNKYAKVKVFEDTDVTRLTNEVEVEKIPEGWLINGVLHLTCTEECHNRYFI